MSGHIGTAIQYLLLCVVIVLAIVFMIIKIIVLIFVALIQAMTGLVKENVSSEHDKASKKPSRRIRGQIRPSIS